MARAPYLALLIIITLSSLLNICALRQGHDWGDDFALYIAQAKSLIEGKTEKLLHQNTFTVSHSSYPYGPNLAPWGFPIILSPIYAIFGLNLLAMKVLEVFFFELSLVVIFCIFLWKLDHILTLLLVSLFAFNPLFLLLNNQVNSDIPYLFFSSLSILMIEKVVIENKLSNHRFVVFVLIGLLIFLSYSIRPNGFILLCVLLTVQMVSTSRIHGRNIFKYFINDRLFLLPYGTFALAVIAMYLLLPSWAGSYLSSFNHIDLTLIKKNLKYYIFLPSDFFGLYFAAIIYGFTIPFVASGIGREFKISYQYLIYSVLVLLTLIFLPFVQGIRYILPILPFFIYFFCVGLSNFLPQFHPPLIEFTALIKPSYIFIAFIICFLASQSARVTYANFNHKQIMDGPFSEKSLEMFNFILQHTKENDTIVFFKPRVLRLLTERQSIMVSDFSQLTKKKGDYLVIRKSYDQISARYDQISPYSKEFLQITEMFPRVFENVDFMIFRLKKLAEAD